MTDGALTITAAGPTVAELPGKGANRDELDLFFETITDEYSIRYRLYPDAAFCRACGKSSISIALVTLNNALLDSPPQQIAQQPSASAAVRAADWPDPAEHCSM